MKRKVTRLMLLLVCFSMLLIGAEGMISMYAITGMSEKGNALLGKTAATNAENALEHMAGAQLQSMAADKAAYIAEKFREVESYVNGIASLTEEIYANPDNYPDRSTALPVPKSRELAAQLLWSEKQACVMDGGNVPQKELLKLGNVQDLLVQYNAQNPMVSSCYVATATGYLIQADYIAYSKYGEDKEKPSYYEAVTRQWYQQAVKAEAGAVIYSDVIKDVHEGRDCIVVSKAIREETTGEILAVVGVGSYLDVISNVVLQTSIGETGYAFLLNEKGQVMVSPKAEGDVAVHQEGNSIFADNGEEAEAAVRDMTQGNSGIKQMELDGKEVWLAYTPLQRFGWSLAIAMEVEEVVAPAKESNQTILQLMNRTETTQKRMLLLTTVIYWVLFFLAAMGIMLVGSKFSRKLTKPIDYLASEVKKIDGGNLDQQIQIHTGDEVEELAHAFNHMTNKLKEYISNLADMTKERERIHTEIRLASKIQEDMLPEAEGDLKGRREMFLATTMTPAKGVGGDFYDFFLIDEEHLAMVMADVSGKGIPAALFMVVARTLLRSQMLAGKPLSEVAASVNNSLCTNNNNGMFVTAWFGILTIPTGMIRAINAGHCYPLIRHKDGTAEYCTKISGMVLAELEDMPYEEYELTLKTGDTFLLYTDGVTEASNEQGKLYGEEKLINLVEQLKPEAYKGEEPNGFAMHYLEDVSKSIIRHQGTAQQADDITMLALEWKGYPYETMLYSPDMVQAYEIEEFLKQKLEQYPVSYQDRMTVLTMADEISANICHYSNASGAAVRLYVGEGGEQTKEQTKEQVKVILCFEDNGIPYNPLEQLEPDVNKPLSKRKTGGLGIYLVRKLADQMLYEYSDGKNCLMLINTLRKEEKKHE